MRSHSRWALCAASCDKKQAKASGCLEDEQKKQNACTLELILVHLTVLVSLAFQGSDSKNLSM